MGRKLAAITIGGASLIGGGVVGAALGVPSLASAQDATATTEAPTTTTPGAGTGTASPPAPPADRAGRIKGVLDPLVADGTLTQEQADKVAAAFAAAAPEHDGRGPDGGFGGPGGAFRGEGFSLSTVATALGLTEDEVRSALQDGTTVAELAQSKGVDVGTVVDALVAAATDRIDQAVTDGRLTQARADELTSGLRDRIQSLVDDGFPARGPWGGGRGGHGPHAPGEGTDAPPPATSTEGSSTTTS